MLCNVVSARGRLQVSKLRLLCVVQAVPQLAECEVQATGGRHRAGCSQYEPADLPEAGEGRSVGGLRDDGVP